MKVNKTQALLFIYDCLLTKGQVNRYMIMSEISITLLTFHRYMQELRAYLLNFNKNYELVYFRQEDIYKIIKRD